MTIIHAIATFFAGIVALVSGGTQTAPVVTNGTEAQPQAAPLAYPISTHAVSSAPASGTAAASPGTQLASGQKVYTQDELLAMAGNPYANGSVPLGDYKYVTSGPKKGYVYLCNVHKDNPGSMVNGPWIQGDSWNFLKKVTVQGSVSWPNASFSNLLSGVTRTLSGNGLPISHATGVFPVASSDPAHQYDANPNTISVQQLRTSVPAQPTYSSTPYCMGGEVGIMLTGVPLFNGFDAGLRDAPAHELQDSCEGHPQGSGEYHYHSLSGCFKDISETTVLGFAYDGFPITGPQVAAGKFLTTKDLDECHGLTSEVVLDGKKTVTYHYVMTQDFPYSASCFRGKPVTTGPSGGAPSEGSQNKGASQQTMPGQGQSPSMGGTPPQEALDACKNSQVGASCTISTPSGSLQGVCQVPPGQSAEACVPAR